MPKTDESTPDLAPLQAKASALIRRALRRPGQTPETVAATLGIEDVRTVAVWSLLAGPPTVAKCLLVLRVLADPK